MTRFHTAARLGMLAVLLLGVIACAGDRQTNATPEEAIARVTQGLAEGHPEVVWQALPASYQKDVTDLLHEAAGKMDEELWNQSFAVLGKLTHVLSEKREFILEHPMLASQVTNKSGTETDWDAVVGFVDVFTSSELSDLGKLKRLDVEKFLAGTGARAMKHLADASALARGDKWAEGMERLRGTKATVVSSQGDTATVRIEVPGEEPREDAFVRVEGKWIPKEMADEWPRKIAEAKAELAELSDETIRQNKPMILMQLSMLERLLDSLLAARTAEEFHSSVNAAFGMVLGQAIARGAGELEPGPGVGAGQPTVQNGWGD